MSDIFERLSRILRAEFNRFRDDFLGNSSGEDSFFDEAMDELDDFLSGKDSSFDYEAIKNRSGFSSLPEDVRAAFDVLGVSYDSSPDEVKRAYRAAMMRCHPDRFANDESALRRATEEAKRLNQAYSVIRDFFKAGGA